MNLTINNQNPILGTNSNQKRAQIVSNQFVSKPRSELNKKRLALFKSGTSAYQNAENVQAYGDILLNAYVLKGKYAKSFDYDYYIKGKHPYQKFFEDGSSFYINFSQDEAQPLITIGRKSANGKQYEEYSYREIGENSASPLKKAKFVNIDGIGNKTERTYTFSDSNNHPTLIKFKEKTTSLIKKRYRATKEIVETGVCKYSHDGKIISCRMSQQQESTQGLSYLA